MNFLELFEKLGKQPIRLTKETPVCFINEGKSYPLKLKFDQNNKPFFVLDEKKVFSNGNH